MVTAMAAAATESLGPWMHGESQNITFTLEYLRGEKVGSSVIEAPSHKVDVIGIHESSQTLIADVEKIDF